MDNIETALRELGIIPETRPGSNGAERIYIGNQLAWPQVKKIEKRLRDAGVSFLPGETWLTVRSMAEQTRTPELRAFAALEPDDQLKISDCVNDLEQRAGLDADGALEVLASIGRLLCRS